MASEAIKTLYARGFEQLQRGEYRAAERDLSQVATFTQSWEASLALAFAQQRLGETARASDSSEQAISRARAQASTLGRAESESNQAENASRATSDPSRNHSAAS